jgi:hypothetical protein
VDLAHRWHEYVEALHGMNPAEHEDVPARRAAGGLTDPGERRWIDDVRHDLGGKRSVPGRRHLALHRSREVERTGTAKRSVLGGEEKQALHQRPLRERPGSSAVW